MLHEHLITFSNCDEDKIYTRGKILQKIKMKREVNQLEYQKYLTWILLTLWFDIHYKFDLTPNELNTINHDRPYSMHPISPFKNTHFYYFINDYEIRKCIFISTITQHENIIQVPTNDKQITYTLLSSSTNMYTNDFSCSIN